MFVKIAPFQDLNGATGSRQLASQLTNCCLHEWVQARKIGRPQNPIEPGALIFNLIEVELDVKLIRSVTLG